MKLNEIIELNGKEYTVELNRESIVRIEQYTNLKDAGEKISKPVIEDKSKKEIDENENPFADEINDEEIEKINKEKAEAVKNVFRKSFWIWLYPVEKLSFEQVKEILEPYFENDDKAEYIVEKYQYLSNKSVEVREKYLAEQKNLKALTK